MDRNKRRSVRRGFTGSLYAALTSLGGPLVNLLLARRRARGREDAARMNERRGHPSRARPHGPLAWIHAASIGEALSVLRLVERLLARYPGLNILVTTGTVTSAQLLEERLPARAFHQYVPVDRPSWVARFLDHWRPDVGMWVESELWPNLVFATQARGIPMVLLNARMSARSYARWRRMAGLGASLLGGFSLVMAQDAVEADRLRMLGADPVTTPGNLKYAAGPLPHDDRDLTAFQDMIGARPVWVASSTHEGEEEICAYVHRRVAQHVKGLLTVIVPRHPARGPAVAQKLRAQGATVARRAAAESVGPETEIYIADTLGELGLFYRAAAVALIGGSLIPHGGQNLLEPARLGTAVLHGPHMDNFRAIVDEMTGRGAAHEVADAEELVKALERLMGDEELRREIADTGERIAAAKDGILDTVLAQLEPVMAGFATRAQGGSTAPAPGRERR